MNKQKYIFIAVILVVVQLFISCGPPKPVEERVDCTPNNLMVAVNDGMMDVSWTDDCKSLISGYNVYISEEPLTEKYPSSDIPASVDPHNTAPFSGDTNPEDGIEHYIAERLENGKKYFVSVRVLYPDNTMSKPSSEKVAVCGPRGEIELSIRYKSNQDGYSFEKDDYVRADKMENDLYYYSKDGVDYLCSPTRLDSFLKANKLKNLNKKGNIQNIAKSIQSSSVPDKDRVEIKKGDWLWIMTPQKQSSLVEIKGFDGSGEDRKVKLYFAFSPIKDELIF